MAVPFLSAIDLLQNELRNARIQNLASDPGTPVLGQFWYNSTSNKLKYYDGAVRTIVDLSATLDTLAAPAVDLSINNHKLVNVATPTTATDAATKGYVDSVALGLDIKASVRAATTVNGTLATAFANGQAIDGVTLATGDRILLKNQTTGSENGIYIVAASGAPTRATDFVNPNVTDGAFAFVEQGTVQAGSSWVLQTQGAINVGTTALVFVQFSGGATYSAGSGLTLASTTFSVVVSGSTIEIVANALRVKSSATVGQPLLSAGAAAEAAYGALNLAGGASIVTNALPIGNGGTGAATAAAARTALGATTKFAQAVGDGVATSIVVTHNLGTQDVHVQVYTASGLFQQVGVEIQYTSVNTITLVFAVAPTSGQYRVVVIG